MYSLRRPAMLRDSRFGRPKVTRGYVVCAGGGERVLAEGSRVRVAVSGTTDVLAVSPSVAFVPDPSPGDASRLSPRAGDATGVGVLAASASSVGSSTATLVGDGTAALVVAVVSGARGGELVPSSSIAVALQGLPS